MLPKHKEDSMTKTWKGKIAVDIRDSEPDWIPFTQPIAPEGAPNILFIVWDDVGYGTMDTFGGPKIGRAHV